MSSRKHQPISIHPTLHGKLEVDWGKEYNGEFNCPHCQTGKITSWGKPTNGTYKFAVRCNTCRKTINLIKRIPDELQLKNSIHQTLNGILKVDWKREYQQEYNCPHCDKEKLTQYYVSRTTKGTTGGLFLLCNCCRKSIFLTCCVPAYIYNYLPEIECPNPLCTDIGHDGQKGWIYKNYQKKSPCTCRFCKIIFNPVSKKTISWVGCLKEDKLLPFSFDEDIWDLRHFYDTPYQRKLSFKEVKPY